MIIRIKKNILERAILSLFLLLGIAFVLIGVSFTTNYAIGATNITNVSVIARLNVTNTEPNITNVVLDDGTASPANEIDLIANGVKAVTCNATVFDYNGWADIDPDSVNATLFVNSTGPGASDDNNDHYTNQSCGRCIQISATEAGCDCRFAVQYYANASNRWVCNITITDRGGTGKKGSSAYLNLSDSEVSNLTTVTNLLAINLSTDSLDYGNLSVTQTSDVIERNISNAGNVNFNLTLRNFGGDNETLGENVSMVCDLGNISFGNHRYRVGLNESFELMKNITNKTIDTNFTISQRINDNGGVRRDLNSTFWRLQIPLRVGGLCNGTIIFGAVQTTIPQ